MKTTACLFLAAALAAAAPAASLLAAVPAAALADPAAAAAAPASAAGASDYFPPPESEGGWRKLASPADIRGVAGMDPERLEALRQWLLRSDGRNFAAVVIRRGYIVLEVERGNSSKTDARRVASVSKAVCATVLAIASERSRRGETPRKMSFDDRAFDFIPWAKPLSDPRKAEITVAQLLNHTSGICPEATGAPNDGTWQYVLGHSGDARTARLAFDPGKGCGYSTIALDHAALVCENVTGKPYDRFAVEALFRPIGCEHWWFQYFEGGEGIGRHPSHGLGMPARDLARIAYCMMRNGRWRHRQVIPKWFVEETARPTHSVTTPEMRFKIPAQVFSHAWELPARLTGEGGTPSGKGIPADARYKPGSGGQLIAFVPSLDLVVTRQTGGSGNWHYAECLRRACAAVADRRPAKLGADPSRRSSARASPRPPSSPPRPGEGRLASAAAFLSTSGRAVEPVSAAQGGRGGGEPPRLSDSELLTLVQRQTFRYFWQGAEPHSGMAYERIHVGGGGPPRRVREVAVGGSGFGLLAILVALERGFVVREEALERLERIAGFLERADRFHGAWPHWLDGETGEVIPFSRDDDGADLVETAYLAEGLLAARQALARGTGRERRLAGRLDRLWRGIEWDWFRKGGENVLYWHWSPRVGWKIHHPVRGYNECLIMYVLAASSPTHPVPPEVYHEGWARGGAIVRRNRGAGLSLALIHNGAGEEGGPLFWAHYSFLGLDPRGLSDRYADYGEHNRVHVLLNRRHCIENPGRYEGYGESCWGLTASYSPRFYDAHRPDRDLGVIAPTAALASYPYAPEAVMPVIEHFYRDLGEKLWGPYGFFDAFSEHERWVSDGYLAIDQGPIVVMIENGRTGLLWDLFMSCPEVQAGLRKLGFRSPHLAK